MKNDKIDGYVYQPCYYPGRIYIAWGPRHFGDFRKIFLPNIGEAPPQKKFYHLRTGAPGTVHYLNLALITALRL